MISQSVQYSLFGKSFENIAIDRIKEYEPKDGYYLSFSGGKDSVVIYDLTERAGVNFDAHFHVSGVDPPEIYKFIREYYPKVIWEYPKQKMFQLIRKKQMLPTRNARFCCSLLKETGGPGRVVMLGIRRAESQRRRNREVFQESYREKGKFLLNPILEWSTQDVWDYIRARNLSYCSLYDEGAERIGCVMCPMQSSKGMEWDKKRFPRYYQAYLKVVRELVAKGRYAPKSAEEVMEWWIYGR